VFFTSGINAGGNFFSETAFQSRLAKNICAFIFSIPPVSFDPNLLETSLTKKSSIKVFSSGDILDRGSKGISSFKMALVSPSFVFARKGRYINTINTLALAISYIITPRLHQSIEQKYPCFANISGAFVK
jgi:hypothetical protein